MAPVNDLYRQGSIRAVLHLSTVLRRYLRISERIAVVRRLFLLIEDAIDDVSVTSSSLFKFVQITNEWNQHGLPTPEALYDPEAAYLLVGYLTGLG